MTFTSHEFSYVTGHSKYKRARIISACVTLEVIMSATSGVQLTAIERKNILKTAEQLCKSTHCKSSKALGRVRPYTGQLVYRLP